MTKEGIDEVEGALGWPLPSRYRQLLRNFPPALFRPEAETGERYPSSFADSQLYHTARSILRGNRGRRAPGGLWTCVNGVLGPWPDDYLVIGDNGGGDVYCIDRNDPGLMVYFHNHESCEFRSLNRTLEEHIDYLIDRMTERQRAAGSVK